MPTLKYAIFALLLLTIATSDSLYHKIVHTTDPDAKCLDGTPPALYVHQGTETDKILIFLEGGGYCTGNTLSEVIDECYKRSKTLLGSSKYWPETFPGQGYLSTDPSRSKFAEWTKIILAYCDGSLHQGHRDEPIKYKDANLYFRGAKIMEAQLAYIDKNFGLSSANKIVWTGGSAGALGSYFWMGKVRQMAKDPNQVYTIPDSGIFMDFPVHLSQTHEFLNTLKNLYKVSNLNQGIPIEYCEAFYQSEPWKCFLVQYNYQFLRGKIMFVNSQYDSWAIYNILKIKCLSTRPDGAASLSKCSASQLKHIQEYNSMYQKVMEDILKIGNNDSCWSIACSNHVYACLDVFYDSPLQLIPELVGSSVKKAIEAFVLEDRRVVDTDVLPWPKNVPCS